MGVPLVPRAIEDLARCHGGTLRNGASGTIRRLVTTPRAEAGDLTVLLHPRYIDDAVRAVRRGALLLADESFGGRDGIASLPAWFHPHAAWAMAELLDAADVPPEEPVVGPGCWIAPNVHLAPRVRLGARVTVAPGAVIGAPGFGWITGPNGKIRAIPQLGGVVIEDDVHVGALCTIAAGTIGPTIVRKGVKLDAQVHVGHNCEIGEGTIVAAQTGLAGSVAIGEGVLVGGQVGIADHVRIGNEARIAAKSGVIGDVPAGATFAGYPAIERQRWLRGLARLFRSAERPRSATNIDGARSRVARVNPGTER